MGPSHPCLTVAFLSPPHKTHASLVRPLLCPFLSLFPQKKTSYYFLTNELNSSQTASDLYLLLKNIFCFTIHCNDARSPCCTNALQHCFSDSAASSFSPSCITVLSLVHYINTARWRHYVTSQPKILAGVTMETASAGIPQLSESRSRPVVMVAG